MTNAALIKASAEPLQGVSALAPSGRTASALEQSAMCHVWTAPGWQVKTSRRSIGRCSHVFGLLARFA